jgi:hypothetical protein
MAKRIILSEENDSEESESDGGYRTSGKKRDKDYLRFLQMKRWLVKEKQLKRRKRR